MGGVAAAQAARRQCGEPARDARLPVPCARQSVERRRFGRRRNPALGPAGLFGGRRHHPHRPHLRRRQTALLRRIPPRAPAGRLSIFEPINRFGWPPPPHTFGGYDLSAGPPQWKTNWDTYCKSSPNPKAPTLEDAIKEALTPDEAEVFISHLRPLVDEGKATRRLALMYLRAIK